ncbi:putative quinol monooxygenase [Nocardia thailandica]
MSVVVLTELLAAPGREDRVRTALEALVEPSLEEPGCLAFAPYADPNRPERLLLVEEWADPDALARHARSAHAVHAAAALSGALGAPASVRRLTPHPPGSGPDGR